jgi:hypothetical protein
METKMPLKNASIDVATFDDLIIQSEILVFSETGDLIIYKDKREEMSDNTIFGLWINCGKNLERTIMFDVEIDELELFANSILKQIQIVRNNYSEQIKYQTDNGIRV